MFLLLRFRLQTRILFNNINKTRSVTLSVTERDRMKYRHSFSVSLTCLVLIFETLMCEADSSVLAGVCHVLLNTFFTIFNFFLLGDDRLRWLRRSKFIHVRLNVKVTDNDSYFFFRRKKQLIVIIIQITLTNLIRHSSRLILMMDMEKVNCIRQAWLNMVVQACLSQRGWFK